MKHQPWSVRTIDEKQYVTDFGGNVIAQLPFSDAKKIVDAHNLDADHEPIEQFRSAVSTFLQDQFAQLVDANDEATSRNYWPTLVLMADGIYAQMLAATNPVTGSLKLK